MTKKKPPLWLMWIMLLFFTAYCVSAVLTATIQFWPAGSLLAPFWYTLLFFPKWWAAGLLLLSLPAVLYCGRWASVVILFCAALQVLWYGGWRFHPIALDESQHGLRLMTFNAGEALLDVERLQLFLSQASVDVIAFQEVPQEIQMDQVMTSSDWFFLRRNKLAVASRYPLEFVSELKRSDVVDRAGYGMVYLVFDVTLPEHEVRFMNVHLDTPRRGLEPFLHRDFDLNNLRNNFRHRYHETSIAADDAKDLGVSIILGDFNMPFESPLYQSYFSEYTNTFSARGNGFGATKFTSWYSIRIDHVLHTASLKSIQAEVGIDIGSDHRPLLANLEFY